MSDYKRALSSIRKVVRDNDYLLNSEFPLLITSLCTDRQDNDHVFYGLRKNEKGDSIFCVSYGHSPSKLAEPIDVNTLAANLTGYQGSYDISPVTVMQDFLEHAREPLERHVVEKARIKEKVQRGLRELEEALKE